MFHSAVRSICASAGWKEPRADEKGVYAFDLEGDISFTLSSPDGERLLARSVLLAPRAGEEIAGETLAAVMRITAARFAKLKAISSLDPETGRLELYAFIGLRGDDKDARETFIENFLNELSFWKAQPALAAPRPFTTG
ncbi:MAG: CesT family type III secretion system chaperone [Deltaproteobacteria bacterium]|nr:CesT family type III secretion system chaperone [Deltaproteobacteria bacterium]